MKKLISIFAILALLIGICIIEEIFVHKFIGEFNNLTLQISAELEKHEDNINNSNVNKKLTSLENYWNNNKNKFCYLVMYDKIKMIDEGVAKLEVAIKHNDNALAQENIAVIECYTDSLHYIMGFNINNLF